MSSPIDRQNRASSPANFAPARPSSTRPISAIVPAAGWGTRLRPLTDAIPKEMLPVGRKLALERIIDELQAAGMTRVVFVLSPAKEPLIRKYFGDGREGIAFAYALQHEMRGLGDAVLTAQPFLDADEPFVIALGDAVFEEATPGAILGRMADAFAAERDAALAVVVQKLPRERLSRYGVVRPETTANGAAFRISDVVEKPAPEDAPSDYAVAARFVARPEIFDTLRQTPPAKNGEVQLTDALRVPLAAGQSGVAIPLIVGEARHDIGALDSYFKAFAAFALADTEMGTGLRSYLEQRLATEKDTGS
jgi:UTP--glucose-1-phosphate uridylyltransferase